MSGGDGLFEIEPVEKKRPQGRPAAVDKTFRAFDPHQGPAAAAVAGRVAA
jgi:hypothetical protein